MRKVMWLSLVVSAGLVTPAAAQNANFRRPEVLKLVQMQPWADVAKVRSTPQGNVVFACETKWGENRIEGQMRWLLVPRDRAQPVRFLKASEVRALGLRTLADAKKEARKLGAAAKYSGGKPYREFGLRDMTTHHTKHQGTGLSYVFNGIPATPIDLGVHPHDPSVRQRAKQVAFSVPVERARRNGQTAWPTDVEHVPVNPAP